MTTSDLLHSVVESTLLDLSTQQATGSLVVKDIDGEEATVWLRDGSVYSVSCGRGPRTSRPTWMPSAAMCRSSTPVPVHSPAVWTSVSWPAGPR